LQPGPLKIRFSEFCKIFDFAKTGRKLTIQKSNLFDFASKIFDFVEAAQ